MSPAVPFGRGPRGFATRVAGCLLAVAAASSAAAETVDESPASSPSQREVRRQAGCNALALSPWPRTTIERRALLQRLDSARDSCKDHGPFLSTLGGIWLEEGEPTLALLWLERSLLIDPTQLGAQADHALALASLGDPTARDQLLLSWRSRSDVPPLIWARLQQSVSTAAGADPAHSADARKRWAQLREATVVFGYESNLDHSPRLSELPITPVGGLQVIPLEPALKPRPGAAAVAELGWQFAYSPASGMVFQAGAQAAARNASAHTETDWHNLQFAASASRRINGWRLQVQAAGNWFGGPLSEPYRLRRVGMAVESTGLGCTNRLAIDHESRVQPENPNKDGRTGALLLSTLCPLTWQPGWLAGLALRAAEDRPVDPTRAGGLQRQASVGARLLGKLGGNWSVDATLRFTRSRDAQGYDALLKDGARRTLYPTQLSIEFAGPGDSPWMQSAEWVWQLAAVRQRSNLEIFSYSSVSLMAGARWKW